MQLLYFSSMKVFIEKLSSGNQLQFDGGAKRDVRRGAILSSCKNKYSIIKRKAQRREACSLVSVSSRRAIIILLLLLPGNFFLPGRLFLRAGQTHFCLRLYISVQD